MPPRSGMGLQEAAAAKRRGETVVQVLAATGTADGGQASPAALHAAIRALRQIGLEKEARALAAEAAVMVGA